MNREIKRVVYTLIIIIVFLSGCGIQPESIIQEVDSTETIPLEVDSTILPLTQKRQGYRFIAEIPLTVELCVRQTGHNDRSLRHQFEASEIVVFGYRFTHLLRPDQACNGPEIQCDLYLGRVEFAEEDRLRSDYPVKGPPSSKMIRFCIGSGSSWILHTGYQKRGLIIDEELPLFDLRNNQSGESLALSLTVNTDGPIKGLGS
jgi:hypothetical protein